MVSRDSVLLRYRYHKYVIEIARTFDVFDMCPVRSAKLRRKTLN